MPCCICQATLANVDLFCSITGCVGGAPDGVGVKRRGGTLVVWCDAWYRTVLATAARRLPLQGEGHGHRGMTTRAWAMAQGLSKAAASGALGVGGLPACWPWVHPAPGWTGQPTRQAGSPLLRGDCLTCMHADALKLCCHPVQFLPRPCPVGKQTWLTIDLCGLRVYRYGGIEVFWVLQLWYSDVVVACPVRGGCSIIQGSLTVW